jgi:hypothetical protein
MTEARRYVTEQEKTTLLVGIVKEYLDYLRVRYKPTSSFRDFYWGHYENVLELILRSIDESKDLVWDDDDCMWKLKSTDETLVLVLDESEDDYGWKLIPEAEFGEIQAL